MRGDKDCDDSEVLTFALENDPDVDGGRGEIAENIYQHQASDFTVVLRQSCAVHGAWADSDASNEALASLLRDPPFRPADDPVVKCFEPAQGVTITQGATKVHQATEKTTAGDVALSAGTPGVAFTSAAHYMSTKSEKWMKHACVRISGIATKTPEAQSGKGGNRNLDAKRLGDDCISWSMKENPYEGEIPDSYGLAVLLQRRDKTRFRVIFQVKATIDFLYELSTFGDTFYGRQQMSKMYDPGREKGKCPDGFRAENLGELSQGLSLAQLSFSHLPEDVQPVQIYKQCVQI
ncbi:hypothetical protein NQ176_g9626 [Zarea fungicola]|uniref:Uncharacterized protein n=1 Tax=Zarea fungicola TaxID=93591 RepID=A0ACC1MKQ6_9HYPO|nr:hypothetical protein NQ176_g9626 [Lecanicillium fungicola]